MKNTGRSAGWGIPLAMLLSAAAYIPTMSGGPGLRRFDSVFDNRKLPQISWSGCAAAEISCPFKSCQAASSINRLRNLKFGLDDLATAVTSRLAKRISSSND